MDEDVRRLDPALARAAGAGAPHAGLKAGEKVYLKLDPEHTLAVQP